MSGLTPHQRDAMVFLQDYTDENGFAPSFAEVMAALDLTSRSSVHRLLTGLEDRGYIRRLPHKARAIDIVRRLGAPIPAQTGAPPAQTGKSLVYESTLQLIARGLSLDPRTDAQRALDGHATPVRPRNEA